MPKRSHDKVDSGTKDERPQKRLRADRLSNLSDELLLRTLSFLAISDLAVCERCVGGSGISWVSLIDF